MNILSARGFTSILFILFNFSTFSQTRLNEEKKINLPPGAVMPLKFDFIDYSYKLDNISSIKVKSIEKENFLFEFSEEDLILMKETALDKYQYYMKANDFYNNLSIKVRTLYTMQELWFIYSYDIQLTNKIISIK
jgi:hypothetical protein